MKQAMKKTRNEQPDCLDGQMTIFDPEFGLSALMMNADLSGGTDEELLSSLDMHIKDTNDVEYQRIRIEISRRLKQQVNPFGAGAPVKYNDNDVQSIRQMKQSGKTNREISKVIGCSASTISRIINQ